MCTYVCKEEVNEIVQRKAVNPESDSLYQQ